MHVCKKVPKTRKIYSNQMKTYSILLLFSQKCLYKKMEFKSDFSQIQNCIFLCIYYNGLQSLFKDI
jgi:hypothetical protein